MKRTVLLLAIASLGVTASAQNYGGQQLQLLNEGRSEYIPVGQYWKEHNILQHLDLSLTVGTTGVGIDLSSPIGKYFQVRAGYNFVPPFNVKMEFPLTINGQPAKKYDADGNRQKSTFDRMNDMLYSISGYEVDDHADMKGHATMHNFRLMLDIFPFRNNRHWHATVGFFWGPKKFAVADNTTEAMTSLLSVGMYNRIYERVAQDYPLFDWEAMGLSEKVIDKYHLNVIPTELYDQIKEFGRLGFGVGYFANDVYDESGNVIYKKGDRYNVEPGKDCMIHVTAESKWSFKPYVGIGYSGNLSKGREDWKIAFNVGAMFWGGKPHLYTHDGVDLTYDIENYYSGKVKDYVELFKKFKAYPVLELRISKRLF